MRPDHSGRHQARTTSARQAFLWKEGRSASPATKKTSLLTKR